MFDMERALIMAKSSVTLMLTINRNTKVARYYKCNGIRLVRIGSREYDSLMEGATPSCLHNWGSPTLEKYWGTYTKG